MLRAVLLVALAAAVMADSGTSSGWVTLFASPCLGGCSTHLPRPSASHGTVATEWLTHVGTDGGAQYKLFTTARRWADAEAECQKEGAHLASVVDLGTHNFLNGVIRANRVRSSVWIGGSDSAREGTWTWTDGQQFVYRNFARRQVCRHVCLARATSHDTGLPSRASQLWGGGGGRCLTPPLPAMVFVSLPPYPPPLLFFLFFFFFFSNNLTPKTL